MAQHKTLLRRLLVICALMFAFSFALVPLYSVFCKLTGINGKTSTNVAGAAAGIDSVREIKVEFLAKADHSIPWSFAPEVSQIRLHPGEVNVVNFRVENMTDEAMVGQAVPSVSPGEAAQYFKKMECFCFTRQPLQARESKLMRLQFYIDPALPKTFQTLTLSYTLFRINEQ
ncbi:MAG TPA: cytochrome c oxidase assembly protein [Cellvibrio sp.]|nr:cytochrome c oxidase assembly protein [Cellvibrio sp.]